MKILVPILISLLLFLAGCQSNRFGECVEQEGYVTPNCLYNGNYPACDLSDMDYLVATRNAWAVEGAEFTNELHLNTGNSQDLGEVCRFYIMIKPELNAMEPYQWMVYIDKKNLAATHFVPVLW